eukprot:2334301-Pyramimonas_sp.AAC.1
MNTKKVTHWHPNLLPSSFPLVRVHQSAIVFAFCGEAGQRLCLLSRCGRTSADEDHTPPSGPQEGRTVLASSFSEEPRRCAERLLVLHPPNLSHRLMY